METWHDKSEKWHYYFHVTEPNAKGDLLPSIFCSKSNFIYMAYTYGKIKIFKINNQNPVSVAPSSLNLTEQFNLNDKLKFYGIYEIFCIERASRQRR